MFESRFLMTSCRGSSFEHYFPTDNEGNMLLLISQGRPPRLCRLGTTRSDRSDCFPLGVDARNQKMKYFYTPSFCKTTVIAPALSSLFSVFSRSYKNTKHVHPQVLASTIYTSFWEIIIIGSNLKYSCMNERLINSEGGQALNKNDDLHINVNGRCSMLLDESCGWLVALELLCLWLRFVGLVILDRVCLLLSSL